VAQLLEVVATAGEDGPGFSKVCGGCGARKMGKERVKCGGWVGIGSKRVEETSTEVPLYA
jgi:hypothetical protein